MIGEHQLHVYGFVDRNVIHCIEQKIDLVVPVDAHVPFLEGVWWFPPDVESLGESKLGLQVWVSRRPDGRVSGGVEVLGEGGVAVVQHQAERAPFARIVQLQGARPSCVDGSFDDYLGSMRASSRKQVRRERRRARSHGLTLRALRGCELEAKHWDALWSFYERTLAFKGAIRYLNPAFFDFLRNEMTDHVFATFAEDDQGNPLAGSLFLTAGDQLFGRYWGAVGRFDCLHFELCYYLPIEWSLNNGIERFEAGAQGEHKLKRGFLPQECYSSHFIRHPGLANAIAEFLPREAEAVGHEIDYYQTHSPFKAPEPTDD